MKKQWASFLEINDSPEIKLWVLWETGKAVLWGIMRYSVYIKKKQQLENALQQKIKKLTNSHANNPSEQIQNLLNYHKMQYENILHKKPKFLIQQLKYE